MWRLPHFCGVNDKTMAETRFVINDEAVLNSHGFYLRNAGLRRERYDANPVVLYDHDLALPIGIGKDLGVEGSKLLFTPEFDAGDELAVKVSKKVEKGHLRGCSPGLIVKKVTIETTAAGEDRYVVTDWELCEVSIVSVPSNRNALRLYNDKMEALSADDIIKMALPPTTNQSVENMATQTTTLALAPAPAPAPLQLSTEAMTVLGLQPADLSDAAAISAAVMELSARAAQAEKKLAEINEAEATSLVDEALKAGKITADKRDSFLTLAKTNLQVAKDTLAAIPARANLSGKVINSTPEGSIPADRAGWSYLRWLKEDPDGLMALKASDPETFEAIRKKKSN